MNRPEPQRVIREMVDRIVERFQPEKVILFGSYARGTATAGSDVDLLVLMPVKESPLKQTVQVRLALSGMGMAKDVIVLAPEQFEAERLLAGTISRTAFLEGKVLYERGH